MYAKVVVIVVLALLLGGARGEEPSTDVAIPTEIQFNQRGGILHGDATVELVIPTPLGLSNVAEIVIRQGKKYCSVENIQPRLNRSIILSITQDGPEILNKEWNVEIMSTALDDKHQTIHTLLDNGSLIITNLTNNDAGVRTDSRLYSFEGIGTVDTWLTDKYKLYYFNNVLYSLSNGELRVVNVHKQGYWRPSMDIVMNNVVSIHVSADSLYVMTLKQLVSFGKGNQKSIILNGQKFIDFDLFMDSYYILDEAAGLIIGSFSKKQSSKLPIVNIQDVVKVRVHKSVLFLAYELESRNYLAEYFISEDKFVLNRYYYNYYSVRDIHLTDKFAVIDGYNEFILLRHSVNRHSFTSLYQLQFLYKSHGVKVVDIKLIPFVSRLQFVLTHKQKVELIEAYPSVSEQGIYAINNVFASCKINTRHSFMATFFYKGTCSNHSSQSHYCSANMVTSLNFEYSHVKKINENKNNKFIFLLVFGTIVFFVSLAFIGAYKRVTKFKKMLKKQQQERKNKVEQHSINMEQTFNADFQRDK